LSAGKQPAQFLDLMLLLLHHQDVVGDDVLHLYHVRPALVQAGQGRIDRRRKATIDIGRRAAGNGRGSENRSRPPTGGSFVVVLKAKLPG
jgi:hypothetical protein